jgi:hypothetical protein
LTRLIVLVAALLVCIVVPQAASATPSWSIVSTPKISEAKQSNLYGIACSSSTFCMSVGKYKNGLGVYVTVAENWNGTEWKVQTTPNPTGAKESYLRDVACGSPEKACTAVGGYVNSEGKLVTLAENWNGLEWKIQTTPIPTGAKETLLAGVSCTSATACAAVGYYKNSSGIQQTLAENWNGVEWKIQTTANPTESGTSILEGVSCLSSTACTAVGWYSVGGGGAAMVAEAWNGTEWKIQPTATGGFLLDVSCFSSTACTAVGYAEVNGLWLTRAMHWNGTEWTKQTTPNPTESMGSQLKGVSCWSAEGCMAVGYWVKGPLGMEHEETLAEKYS